MVLSVTVLPSERTGLLVIRAWVETNGVPRLRGDIQQDLGAASLTVEISGSLHGDEARDDFLQSLRESFRAGDPVSFAADITNAAELDRVLIDELELEEVNDSADGFHYR